jgi:hypothetical protein
MSRTDDCADAALPVTAEVCGEGGSFADPTMQVATFRGNEPNHDQPMTEGHQPAADPDAASGMKRYPTEAPGSFARETGAGPAWRAGVVGAAAGAVAGAAVAFGLMKRRS